MFDDICYVVKFENGKYYSGGCSSNSETDDLKYANKYGFDWQPAKDFYLIIYAEDRELSYELIKIKTIYEIVE